MAVYVWWVRPGRFLVRVFPGTWHDAVMEDTMVDGMLVLGRGVWCKERLRALVYFDQVGTTVMWLWFLVTVQLFLSLFC
jgi:hypothetical protein